MKQNPKNNPSNNKSPEELFRLMDSGMDKNEDAGLDEFDKEALEGLKNVKDRTRLDKIHSKIDEILEEDDNKKIIPLVGNTKNKIYYYSIAASIIIVFGLIFMFKDFTKKESSISLNEPKNETEIKATEGSGEAAPPAEKEEENEKQKEGDKNSVGNLQQESADLRTKSVASGSAVAEELKKEQDNRSENGPVDIAANIVNEKLAKYEPSTKKLEDAEKGKDGSGVVAKTSNDDEAKSSPTNFGSVIAPETTKSKNGEVLSEGDYKSKPKTVGNKKQEKANEAPNAAPVQLDETVTLSSVSTGGVKADKDEESQLFDKNAERKRSDITLEAAEDKLTPAKETTVDQKNVEMTAANFPGGVTVLLKKINENVVIPNDYSSSESIIVGITIDRKGTVTQVKMIRDFVKCKSCTKEIGRAIKKVKGWPEIKTEGKVEDRYLVLPLKFTAK